MAARSAAERKLSAQLAAHASWANTTAEERAARTAKARQGLQEKFLREADGDPIEAERLRKMYFLRLQLKAARGRRLATEARREQAALRMAAEAEAELEELGG